MPKVISTADPSNRHDVVSDVAADALPSAPLAEVEIVTTHRVRRLGWSLIGDATMGAISVEKGFLYTLRRFTLHPRAAFEGYLGEERLRYSNPLKLALFLTAMATLMNYLSGTFADVTQGRVAGTGGGIDADKQARLAEFLERNYNLMLLAALPLFAMVSRVCYGKRAYNLFEHLALNAFIFAVTTTLYLVLLWPGRLVPQVAFVYMLLSVSYQSWVYRRVMGPGWLKAIGTALGSSVVYLAAMILATLAFFAAQ